MLFKIAVSQEASQVMGDLPTAQETSLIMEASPFPAAILKHMVWQHTETSYVHACEHYM